MAYVHFQPHSVKVPLKNGDWIICPVILMKVESKIGKLHNIEPNIDKPQLPIQGGIELAIGDEEDTPDKIRKVELEVIKVDIMVINSRNKKYEWYSIKDVEPIVN